MRILLVLCLLGVFSKLSAQAQKLPIDTTGLRKVKKITMPEFKGGTKAIQFYLSQNMNYPPSAKSKGIEGVVLVNFVIDKKGKVTEVTSSSTADPLLVNEAIRLVKTLPKFKPATADGEPAMVSYSIPVSFKIR